MKKEFVLYRKRKGENEWKSTTDGDLEVVLEVLRLYLSEQILPDFDWKIERINEKGNDESEEVPGYVKKW